MLPHPQVRQASQLGVVAHNCTLSSTGENICRTSVGTWDHICLLTLTHSKLILLCCSKWNGVPLVWTLEELQQAATIASDAFKDSEICFALFTEVFLYGCINASAAYTVLIYLEYASLSNWFEVALHFQDTANLTYTVHLFPIILNLAWFVIWCILLHTYFTNLSQTLKNKRLYSAIFHALPRKWGCIQVWGEVGALCVTMHMWKHNAYLCYLQKNARHMGSKIVYQLKV